MERPNLDKIIKENLDKAKFQSKKQPSLPKGGWLDAYKSGGQTLNTYAGGGQPITCPQGKALINGQCVDANPQNNYQTLPGVTVTSKAAKKPAQPTNVQTLPEVTVTSKPKKPSAISKGISSAVNTFTKSTTGFGIPNIQSNQMSQGSYTAPMKQQQFDTQPYSQQPIQQAPITQQSAKPAAPSPSYSYTTIGESSPFNYSRKTTPGMGNAQASLAMMNMSKGLGQDAYTSLLETIDPDRANIQRFMSSNPFARKFYDGGYISDEARATQFGQYRMGGGMFPEYHSYAPPRMNNGGGLLSRTVTCSNCGWSWKAVDGGKDVMTCHKCGGMIKMSHGGDISIPDLDADKWLLHYQKGGGFLSGVGDFFSNIGHGIASIFKGGKGGGSCGPLGCPTNVGGTGDIGTGTKGLGIGKFLSGVGEGVCQGASCAPTRASFIGNTLDKSAPINKGYDVGYNLGRFAEDTANIFNPDRYDLSFGNSNFCPPGQYYDANLNRCVSGNFKDGGQWLTKYQKKGQVNTFGLANPRDLARQNMGTNESTSSGFTMYKQPEGMPINREAKERAYRTIRPSNYDDVANYARWATNIQRSDFDEPRSEEAWRIYLGVPGPTRYFNEVNVRPTKHDRPFKNYYKADSQLEQDIFNTYKDELQPGQSEIVNEANVKSEWGPDDKLTSDGYLKIGRFDDNLLFGRPAKSRARMLGNFTVGRDTDEKGDYLYYRDIYDFPDWMQSRLKGAPFGIYNRLYYPKDNNKKKKEGGLITDSRGQWAHPGKNTRIPGSDITMKGVPYPVLAKASNGMTTMMYPGQNYSFPGASHVDEYPMMRQGGILPKAQNGRLQRTQPKSENNWLKNIQRNIEESIGHPMNRGTDYSIDAVKNKKAKEEDTLRHAYSSMETNKAIQNKTGNIPLISSGLGFLGANALGVGHELINIFNSTPSELRESGEDVINNFVGSLAGSIPFVSDKNKRKAIQYLSDNGLLPDGTTAGRGRTYNAISKTKKYAMGGWLDRYQDGGTQYTVKPGDNLTRIGRQFGMTPQQIGAANNIQDINKIKVNQVLNIPGAVQQPIVTSAPVAVGPNYPAPQAPPVSVQQPVVPQQKIIPQTVVQQPKLAPSPNLSDSQNAIVSNYATPSTSLDTEEDKVKRQKAKKLVELARQHIAENKYFDVPEDVKQAAFRLGQSDPAGCIGGSCTLAKEAGILPKVYWSNTAFAKDAPSLGYPNKGLGLKGIHNLEEGDFMVYQQKKSGSKDKKGKDKYIPSHFQTFLGVNPETKQYEFFDNYWKKLMTYPEETVKNYLKHTENPYDYGAVIYKNNPFHPNSNSYTDETPQEAINKEARLDSEVTTPTNYKYSIRKDAKEYNEDTKKVMDHFVNYANNDKNLNDLVTKLKVGKDEIHDSLLNVFGELGQENNWSNTGKGVKSRVENMAEKVLSYFGGADDYSVGQGQNKFRFIPEDLRKEFGINSTEDLYDMNKIIPLMVAQDVRNKKVLRSWGDQNLLSHKLIGRTDQDNPLRADDLKGGVGRWSPYLRNEFGLISGEKRVINNDDLIPWNGEDVTWSNWYKPGLGKVVPNYDAATGMWMNPRTLAEGSYPDKVFHKTDDNLQRVMINAHQTPETAKQLPGVFMLSKVKHKKPKKEFGGETNWLDKYK